MDFGQLKKAQNNSLPAECDTVVTFDPEDFDAAHYSCSVLFDDPRRRAGLLEILGNVMMIITITALHHQKRRLSVPADKAKK